MVTDLVADTITRIYNGSLRKLDTVTVLSSKLVVQILEILKKQGFIADFKEVEEGAKKSVEVSLMYDQKEPVVTGVKRISKPGRRIYRGADEINKVKQGRGVGIYSTTKGVLSDKDAYLQKVGGEYLCEIW